MGLDEQKKLVVPYLQRAEEVQKVDAKIAYYCRYYAISQGLKIENRDKVITNMMTAAMNELEKNKSSLQLDEAQDKYYCEQFAINKVFKNAETADLEGRATEVTATTYYAAGIFIDVCRQFYEDGQFPEDLEQKQKYSLWRAAEIRKAKREGRPPVPPPQLQQQQQQDVQDTSVDDIPEESTQQTTQQIPLQPRAQYVAGNKVLYKQDSQTPLQPGTVGQVVSSEGWGQYKVAVAQDIVLATGEQLAYNLSAGDEVTYIASTGEHHLVKIVHVDMSIWKPAYVVRMEDGSERNTEEHKIIVIPRNIHVMPPPDSTKIAPPEQTYPNVFGPQPRPTTPSQFSPAPPMPNSDVAQPRPFVTTQQPSTTPTIPQPTPGYQPPLKVIVEAQKKAKSAASALSFDDVPTAVKHLTDALKLLTQPSQK
eukprot:TRINITY_DN427_c2_g1_i8.p1 TRINITY_DN427_c2_g1~~TRINITY_DN427_c2_g1_i8.p1  ORF type:complete len:422 (-),score=52.85 TRINITY_DN427_c2_g1_i8:366-1631(-)